MHTKLIKLGCNITTRNDQNQTPLDLAPLQLAEELATSRFKFCAKGLISFMTKAINMALFELDMDAKLEDIEFSDNIYKNLLEES
ncbi:hypothetical protein MXB_3471 [Myxobolus squamalis]|nr:hypothetical protein MXB_3471 [Myxobolus squamalis]